MPASRETCAPSGDGQAIERAFGLHASLDGNWDQWSHSLGWHDAVAHLASMPAGERDKCLAGCEEMPDAA